MLNIPALTTLDIEMPSGSPEALCIFTRRGQAAEGMIFSRSAFPQLRDKVGDDRNGVHLLWDAEAPINPEAYVGEGMVLSRLRGHQREKDFWTRGAVFTSSDAVSLDKTVGKHLEAELVRLAEEAGRCALNQNTPQSQPLGSRDRVFASECLGFIRLCLRVAGVRLLEKPTEKMAATPYLYLKAPRKKIESTGYESDGGFTVKEGSLAAKDETRSINDGLKNLRKDLKAKGILIPEGNAYRVTRDYEFKSSSSAAGVLLGSIQNGLTAWTNDQSKTLKDIQAEREQA